MSRVRLCCVAVVVLCGGVLIGQLYDPVVNAQGPAPPIPPGPAPPIPPRPAPPIQRQLPAVSEMPAAVTFYSGGKPVRRWNLTLREGLYARGMHTKFVESMEKRGVSFFTDNYSKRVIIAGNVVLEISLPPELGKAILEREKQAKREMKRRLEEMKRRKEEINRRKGQ